MRFIEKMRAKSEITGICLSIHDYDYCTCQKLVKGVISPTNAMLTYNILLQTGRDGMYRILQKYDIEGLGLQSELNRLDKTISLIDKRRQHLRDFNKTDSKQLDIK